MKMICWSYFIVSKKQLGFLSSLSVIYCISLTASTATSECLSGLFHCGNSTRCISQQYVCDGEYDCVDKSDEASCSEDPCQGKYKCHGGQKCIPNSFTCDSTRDCPQSDDESDELCLSGLNCDPAYTFRCKSRTNQCIPLTNRCDGHVDCLDASDESLELCPLKRSCDAKDQFQCHSQGDLCIPAKYKCDHKIDCFDSSDEKECQTGISQVCHGQHDAFKCSSTDECIQQSLLCNGHPDCSDASDEHMVLCLTLRLQNSSKTSPCQVSTDFYCGATSTESSLNASTSFLSECISHSWRCDGTPDCANGMDEKFCPEKACGGHEFRCVSGGQCVSNVLVCDGHADCADRSDELNCDSRDFTVLRCDNSTQFDCRGDGTVCISWDKVCNDRNDCGSVGEDEKPGGLRGNCYHNLCNADNGNCSHQCQNRYTHRVCACPSGYRLRSDGTTCEDVDECQEQGGESLCSHECINTKGGYKCQCLSGYTRNISDPRKCLLPGEKSFIYATGDSLREIRLQRGQMLSLKEGLGRWSGAVDVDVARSKVFYSNLLTGSIEMLSWNGELQQTPTVLYHNNASLIEGLAYDWVHNLLFWTDAGRKTIFGMNVSSREYFPVVTRDVDRPRALVVDPEEGRLYWSDWGDRPRIETVAIHGGGRQVVLNEELSYPNGLALDIVSRQLFWTDSKAHSISSCNLKTKKCGKLLVRHEHFYPYQVDVLEDRVYWTDWQEEGILSVDKFSGLNMTKIVSCRQPQAVRVWHPMRQPGELARKWNRCSVHNCSHLCLPTPSSGYVCACPVEGGWSMDADRQTCLSSRTTSPLTPTTAKGGKALLVFLLVALLLLILTVAYIVYRNCVGSTSHPCAKFTLLRRKRKISVHFANPVYRKVSSSVTIARSVSGNWTESEEGNSPAASSLPVSWNFGDNNSPPPGETVIKDPLQQFTAFNRTCSKDSPA